MRGALSVRPAWVCGVRCLCVRCGAEYGLGPCDEEAWPDVDQGLVCGECKVASYVTHTSAISCHGQPMAHTAHGPWHTHIIIMCDCCIASSWMMASFVLRSLPVGCSLWSSPHRL